MTFLPLQLPCILWLKIKKPRRFNASWLANWVRISGYLNFSDETPDT